MVIWSRAVIYQYPVKREIYVGGVQCLSVRESYAISKCETNLGAVRVSCVILSEPRNRLRGTRSVEVKKVLVDVLIDGVIVRIVGNRRIKILISRANLIGERRGNRTTRG